MSDASNDIFRSDSKCLVPRFMVRDPPRQRMASKRFVSPPRAGSNIAGHDRTTPSADPRTRGPRCQTGSGGRRPANVRVAPRWFDACL